MVIVCASGVASTHWAVPPERTLIVPGLKWNVDSILALGTKLSLPRIDTVVDEAPAPPPKTTTALVTATANAAITTPNRRIVASFSCEGWNDNDRRRPSGDSQASGLNSNEQLLMQ